MNEIDWMNIPLENFISAIRTRADGTTFQELYPFGDGEVQRLMVGLSADVEEALILGCCLRRTWSGSRPRVRCRSFAKGAKTHKALARLTLRDLPTILDTLVALEEDHRRREREEAERKTAERKTRKKVLAKERRKLKKLGEW